MGQKPDLMQGVQAIAARLHELRHEQKNLDVCPIPGIEDYSVAGIAIEKAMQHLNEGIPNGQRERCMLALGLLESGVTVMAEWLVAANNRSQKL